MKRKIIAVLLVSLMVFSLAGCQQKQTVSQTDGISIEEKEDSVSSNGKKYEVEYTDSDNYFEYGSDAQKINMSGKGAETSAEGVTVSEGKILINKAGSYVLSGSFEGSLVIEAGKKDKIFLFFDNAKIVGTKGPAIYEKEADKVVILLPEGTVNYIEDAKDYEDKSEKAPTAAIYCKDSLTVTGKGNLSITGNYNDAVTSKGKLKIMDGSVNINAADDGLVGKNLVAVKDGNISVVSGGDAIKSTKEDDEEKGNVVIEGGNISLKSQKDALQAENSICVKGGSISIATQNGAGEFTVPAVEQGRDKAPGGKMPEGFEPKDKMPEDFGPGDKKPEDTEHQGKWQEDKETSYTTDKKTGKGFKAGNEITVCGGTISIDSEDDAFNAGKTITLENAVISIETGDDAIHSESLIVIRSGEVDIANCKEGIESPEIRIDGGKINLLASDDGMNAPGGENAESKVVINGGDITINAYGDGIDSNGTIEVNGGFVFVSSSSDGSNNALDYDEQLLVNAGCVVASGSAEMYQSISTDSECVCIDYIAEKDMKAGTKVVLLSGNDEVLSFVITKDARSILISGDIIKKDASYSLSVDGKTTDVTVSEGSDQTGGFGGKGFGGRDFGDKRGQR